MAAPMATASSGLTDLFGVLPKIFLTNYWTFGILVIPPTRMTYYIFYLLKPESLIHDSHGLTVLFKNSSVRPSSLALVIL
jgi:hypothetical protein